MSARNRQEESRRIGDPRPLGREEDPVFDSEIDKGKRCLFSLRFLWETVLGVDGVLGAFSDEVLLLFFSQGGCQRMAS